MGVLRDMAANGRTLLLSIHQMTDRGARLRLVSCCSPTGPSGAQALSKNFGPDRAAGRTFGGYLPCAHLRFPSEDRCGRCSPRKCARSRAAAPFGSCSAALRAGRVQFRKPRSFTARQALGSGNLRAGRLAVAAGRHSRSDVRRVLYRSDTAVSVRGYPVLSNERWARSVC